MTHRFVSSVARLRALTGLLQPRLMLGLWLLTASTAHAATLNVTNTADSGAGSLRQAITAAVSNDTINITATGTVTLGSGEIAINKNLVINGPGTATLAISGNDASRIFNISGATVSISNLTLRGGRAAGTAGTPGANGTQISPSGGPGGPGGEGQGGAIFNTGQLSLSRVNLTNNTAQGGNGGNGGSGYVDPLNPTMPSFGGFGGSGGAAQGGAIYNSGTLQVTEVTFSGNTVLGGNGGVASDPTGMSGMAGNAGGGAVYNSGTLTVTGTTFNSNAVTGGSTGGTNFMFPMMPGSGQGGAIYSAGTLQLTNCTLAANTATAGFSTMMGGLSQGGGIMAAGGTITLLNATISGNTANAGIMAAYSDGGGVAVTATSPGTTLNATNCIIAGNTATNNPETSGAMIVGTNNLIGSTVAPVDPQLGPLQDNGGPTHTMAISATSPARDAGTGVGAPATDQRGIQRPQGFVVDIGAFEFALSHSVSGTIKTSNGTPIAGVSVSRSATLSEPQSTPVLTDSNGNYTLPSVPAGNHTLTASKSGYSFSPATRIVNVAGAAVTGQNFTGYNTTLTGRVAFSNGSGIGNVEVRLNIGRTAITNSAGYYTFTGMLPGGYTVTPVRSGYSFDPALRSLTIGTTNVSGINFIGGYTITGRLSTSSGVGIANHSVSLSGRSTPVTTNSAGYYSFYGVLPGSYTITPSPIGYGFTPQSRSVVVSDASVGAQNFIGTTGFRIMGRITTSAGVALPNVQVSRNGSTPVTTNSAGYYTFNGVPNGAYTITPNFGVFTFAPANRSVTVNGADVGAQNFSGSGP